MKGHLDHLLPKQKRQVQHHGALAYTELPAFIADLKIRDAIAARALEFAILTAGRTSEVLGATWGEIDLPGRVWTVPGSRMKAGKEHRVPLSDAAVAVLEQMQAHQGHDGYVFPGQRRGRPLSNMAFLMLMRRMKRSETAHGFRSTFRDWCAECTGFPEAVAEAALAHTVGNKVIAAYRRTDFFDKRTRLMAEWGTFCTTPRAEGTVIPLHSRV